MIRKLGRAIALAILTLAAPSIAQEGTEIPRIECRDGKHALMVDGAPFVILGGQANNSSNYAPMLDSVWPVLDRMNANTLEMPVAWEQVEPAEGEFDFSFLQTLLDQARAHDKRLVILWFATWKNTSYAYAPAWVKLDSVRFPRMKRPDGSDHVVLSAHGEETLAADRRAFVKLMEYLRDHDRQNTVIMVQVQNEAGSYALPRDHSRRANELFAMHIPQALARAMGKSGTWTDVFGKHADRAFNSWYVASYIDAVARAGKAIKPLPLYVNASLAGVEPWPDPNGVSSGGPQQDVLDIWKVAAPSLDFAAPDIYDRNGDHVRHYLDAYARPDNALMIPEIGNSHDYARFFYEAIGRGAIGFAPFGTDASGYSNYPLGSRKPTGEALDNFGLAYAGVGSIMRDWARLAWTRPVWGAAKRDDNQPQSKQFGDWSVTASWGENQFGFKEWTWLKQDPPPWADQPVGGLAVIQLSENEFLLVGDHVRVTFAPAEGSPPNGIMLSVEEGTFANGAWVTHRVWNGDQTDYGINLVNRPQVLKVTMGHYR